MAAISSAQHLAFLKLVRDGLAKAGPGVLAESIEQEAYIKKQINDMERLRADYQHHLRAIHAAIRKYETIKKEARITLRKRLAASKRKTIKDQSIFNPAISKAS